MKMLTRAELKNKLIDAGVRPSVQRLAIFEYVHRSTAHNGQGREATWTSIDG